MPPKPSMTLRLTYLPRPNDNDSEPSVAAAVAQTFSVHARSAVEDRANVSTI
jgi:hypothetical protein